MKQYLDLVNDVLLNGVQREDRTGTGTVSVFGRQLRFDLRDGFPAVTTKKLFIKSVWVELLWMLSGESNIKFMKDKGVHIWDNWADENGELGPVYGVQWRRWKKYETIDSNLSVAGVTVFKQYVDQLQQTIDRIRNNPTDRRLVVTAWNPGELDEMALPPCHLLYQFYVDGPFLDIQVYQRSADVFLGVPFDIASYATLLSMVAKVTGKVPRDLVYTLGDTHIYLNHVEQMFEQVERKPYPLPELYIAGEQESIDDFKLEDFSLVGYEHHPHIKGDISV